MLDRRLEALGTDYVDLFFIHGLGDDHSARRGDQLRQGPGVQGDGRRDPQVGQGEVHRLLDPPQGPRRDHPGGGRRRDRRRDHAPVHPLARQGLPAEQGARRLPREGDRPDLDEAGRRPVPGRADLDVLKEVVKRAPMLAEKKLSPTRACCTRSGPTSGSAARASRSRRPTSSARTPTPPAATSRSRPPSSSSSATRPWPSPGPSAPIATADARSPPAPRPSWAT